MRYLCGPMTFFMLAGCSMSDSQVREAVKKDPKIVLQVIEEHPSEFVESVNRAVAAAQNQQREKRMNEIKASQERDLKNPRKPALDEKRRLSGSPTGKIVLVEYGDFQCPACGMAYEGLKKFKERHKDDVQFYFKNMPLDFHKMAEPSAKVYEAIALRDVKAARKFYDYVFSRQRELADDGFLRKAIAASGANPDQIEKDLKNETVLKRIREDMEEFNKFGFSGTPTVILNGVALEGAQDEEGLERALALTELRR